MRFFFNLAGAVYDPDNEGTELASMSDARIEAVKFAGQFLKDQPEVVWLGDELRVEVTDSNQLILFTVIVFGVDAAAAKGL
jgi:hypothetical protein